MKISLAAKDQKGLCVGSIWNQRRSRLLAAVAFFTAVGFSSHALATSQGVQFTSQVTTPNACTINVIRDGGFGIGTDKKVLSSKLPGGLSAIADVVSGRNYDVTAEAPTGFSVGPSGSALNTTFEARFSGIDVSRGRTFAERNGSSSVKLRGGNSITRLNVHLIATRTGSIFPTGTYEGTVVIRCE